MLQDMIKIVGAIGLVLYVLALIACAIESKRGVYRYGGKIYVLTSVVLLAFVILVGVNAWLTL